MTLCMTLARLQSGGQRFDILYHISTKYFMIKWLILIGISVVSMRMTLIVMGN